MPTTNYIASSPAIGYDGTIYFGSSNGNLYAVYPDGRKKWQYTTEGTIDDSPTISRDGTIYFGSFDTYFYALTPEGEMLWKFKTGDLIRSTPAVAADSTIIFGSYDGYLYALNSDGTLKWKYEAGVNIATSPLIAIDGNVYFGAKDGKVYALNPDGEFMWKYTTGGTIHWSSPAAGYDGILYIGSFDGYLYSIYPDGTLRWRYKTGAQIGSSPVLGEDGTVYFESCDSYFYAVNADGTLKWRYNVQNSSYGCHPVIGYDGTIYVGSDDNYFYALTSEGTLKWKFKTNGPLYTTGANINDSGIIYFVSTDGNLYAFDTGTNAGIADTPWPKFHRDIRNSGIMEMFSIFPSHLKIRDVTVNETGEGTLIIKNYDTEPLIIEHIGVDNEQFEITPESAEVMPSDSILITVTFSPVTEDEQQAIIMVHLDNREIPVYVFGNPPPEPIRVPVRLISRDGDTGELLPCRVYFSGSNGRHWMPETSNPLDYRWFFNSPGDTTLIVLSGKYNLSMYRGNEYVPIQDDMVDVSEDSVSGVTVEKSLVRWINMKELGWYSCDNQVNEFGGNNPRGIYYSQLAEDLNILHFIAMGWFNETFNYEYWTSEKYPFSIPFYPMVIGEEWRSESYQNHMVIMNHDSPLSQWGNGYYTGVSPYPYTYPPALDFCDETHELGGIVVVTHPFVFWEPFTFINDGNRLAYEMPVDVALGKIDGMQIYCYGSHPWKNSQYDEWNLYVWYKLLNCGFRIPPFAGTDAYMNMTSDAYLPSPPPGKVRSYVYVPGQIDDLSYDDWIHESVRGRSFVSSGAVLFFTVNGNLPGTEISLNSGDGTATVTVVVDARWKHGINNISLIVNGKQAAYKYGNYQENVVSSWDIKLTESSWIAAKVEGTPFDYYNGDAHSGPVYVTLNNKPINSPEDADFFVEWIDKHIALLDSIDQFDTDAHKERTFSLYREGQDVFRALADTTSSAVMEGNSQGRFALFTNVPNPFNSSTLISFELPEQCQISLEMYNVLGQQVKTVFTGKLDKGIHKFQVNMKDIATGVYFLRLSAPMGKMTQKMLYIR